MPRNLIPGGDRLLDRHNKPFLLFTLLGIYLAVASAWALFVPPYEKPDELSHFDYFRFVAREGRLPDLDEGLIAGWEAHQPPLFYFAGAGIYRLVTGLGVEQSEPAIWVDRGNPNFYWKVERNREKLGESNLYEHPESLFHPQGTFPYDLIAVRIFSVLLGMVTILFTYLTARIFFSTAEEAAILAAAVVAFLPQFTFITSSVSNDSIAFMLGAIAIFQYARMLAEPQPRTREYLILGVLLGLGALSKNSNLSLGIGVLLLVIRDFVRDRKMVKGGLAWLKEYAWLLLGFFLIAGWWYARNYLRYGDLLARQWIIEPEVFGWDAYSRTLGEIYFQFSGGYFWKTLFQSFYGYFGFLNIRLPVVYYQLGLVFLAISAIGYPIFVLTKGKSPLGRFLLYLMPGVLLLGALVQLVAYNLTISQPQGRYLFHTLSAFAIFTTAGFAGILAVLRKATPKLRDGGERSGLWREGMTWGLILAMAGVNLYALFGVLLPAYNIIYLGLLFDAF